MKSVLAVLSIVTLSGALFAQDGAASNQDPVEKARAVYQGILAQRDAARKELEDLKAKARQYAEKSKERGEIDDRAKIAFKNAKAPLDPFFAVFKDVDWTKFDAEKDKQLLRDGLTSVATKAGNGEKAIAASRMFVKLFPDDRTTSALLARNLPLTLLSLDRDDDAVKELLANTDKDKDNRAAAFVLLGDIESIRGNFDAAKKAFADASALGSKAIAEIAAAKAAVVGKPAPALDSKSWVGADPIAMADLKGKVVLLGFFATWAPPARAALAMWNRIRDEKLAAGLVTIGVTRAFPHGYLPADESQVDVGGTSRQGMTPEQYLEHLRQYHTNTKLHLPFVVIEEAAFNGFGIKPLPTTVLLDRESRITLISTRLQDDELVAFGLRRLMKAK